MAKLYRPKTPARPQKARMLERAYTGRERQRYHALAGMYGAGLETKTDKEILVEEMPLIAAQLFYYLDDREIGSMLAERYTEHPEFELREIAHYVAGVLDARSSASNNLSTIAGMHTVPGELLEELAYQKELPRQYARQYAELDDNQDYESSA